MGDKARARKLCKKAKVPIIPGSEGSIGDEKEALKVAKKLDFLLLLKPFQEVEAEE